MAPLCSKSSPWCQSLSSQETVLAPDAPQSRDTEYFRQPTRPPAQLSDNWVLRFNALKRLYRLLIQYFSDVLDQNTSALEVPDLQSMAKDHSVKDTLIMCRLTIAIAVQCDNNKHIIDKIQSLSDTNQHYLMKAIEQVREVVHSCTRDVHALLGYGQSSGVRGHPGHFNDDRVHTFHPSPTNSSLTSAFHQRRSLLLSTV
jgi:hypothetical protein